MERRNIVPAIALFAGAAATASAAPADAMQELLALSAKEKKGVMVYVNGQQIGMLVTEIGPDYVQGRSQAQYRIVVRRSAIDAVTMA